MADNSSFPIDIQAAKNTKLYKKFLQGKNKSIVAPSIQNVSIPDVQYEQNLNTSNQAHSFKSFKNKLAS